MRRLAGPCAYQWQVPDAGREGQRRLGGSDPQWPHRRGRSHAQAIGPCAQTINLRGATVIPGLIDSHVHYLRAGTNPGHEVRIIETATSIAELQQMISDRLRRGRCLTAIHHLRWRLEPNGFAERRLPTPAELDEAAPGIRYTSRRQVAETKRSRTQAESPFFSTKA